MQVRRRYQLPVQSEHAVLRIISAVSMLPSNFHDTIGRTTSYPARNDINSYLGEITELYKDEGIQQHANILLVALQKKTYTDKQKENLPALLSTLTEWWSKSSSSRYAFEKALLHVGEAEEDLGGHRNLKNMAHGRPSNIVDVNEYCSPFQSCAVLSVLARLALEPEFKPLFLKLRIMDPLVGALRTSVWGEAREAAACIANLC